MKKLQKFTFFQVLVKVAENSTKIQNSNIYLGLRLWFFVFEIVKYLAETNELFQPLGELQILENLKITDMNSMTAESFKAVSSQALQLIENKQGQWYEISYQDLEYARSLENWWRKKIDKIFVELYT